MDIAKPDKTKELLDKHNLELKKSLGQNFLVDNKILDKIVAQSNLSADDTVIEIGPGIGALTQKLAEVAGDVVAVEVDQRLEEVLDETLAEYDNVEVVFGDALEVDFDELVDGKYKIVANLPYYITTPIVMRLLEEQFKSINDSGSSGKFVNLLREQDNIFNASGSSGKLVKLL
jgi:16S rRNA (adenine1518-N6/adenine1519-N6)-dimethyltransferase